MSPELFINLLSFIFLFFVVNQSSLSHAYTSYANSPHAHSSQSNDHYSPALNFLQKLIGTHKGYTGKGAFELKKYLSNLGYMKGGNDSNVFDNNLESALKKYQLFFNLEQSGMLENSTIQTLLKPRCGMPDVHHDESVLKYNNPLMVSHYTFLPNNPKWPPTKKILTYSFQPGTRGDVVQPIARATAQWAKVTHFKFNYIKDYEKADIKISFQLGDHGDGAPFDGPWGYIAHSVGPLDGTLHYDGAENWVDGVAPGCIDLQTTGLHELGHILGLGHSTDPNSVMYAIGSVNSRIGLSEDDIAGVIAIYENY